MDTLKNQLKQKAKAGSYLRIY